MKLEIYRLFVSRDLLTSAALDRVLNGLSTWRNRGDLPPLATGKCAHLASLRGRHHSQAERTALQGH